MQSDECTTGRMQSDGKGILSRAERRTPIDRKRHGHASIVFLLLHYITVDVNRQNSARTYALMLLTSVIRCYLVAILIASCVVRSNFKGGTRALNYSIQIQHVAIMEIF